MQNIILDNNEFSHLMKGGKVKLRTILNTKRPIQYIKRCKRKNSISSQCSFSVSFIIKIFNNTNSLQKINLSLKITTWQVPKGHWFNSIKVHRLKKNFYWYTKKITHDYHQIINRRHTLLKHTTTVKSTTCLPNHYQQPLFKTTRKFFNNMDRTI